MGFRNRGVTVTISPTNVIFSEDGEEPVSLAPIVHVSSEPGPLLVLAVGNAPSSVAGFHSIAVFTPEECPTGVSKFDCLTWLFLTGFRALIDRSFIRLRPVVTVVGIESVAPVFGGYAHQVIEAAMLTAGAKSVRWPGEEPASRD